MNVYIPYFVLNDNSSPTNYIKGVAPVNFNTQFWFSFFSFIFIAEFI